MKNYNKLNLYIVVALICLVAFVLIAIKCNRPITSTPVEDIRIDSLKSINADIILEVESINSIKNAKVIEVKELDNDSTLKLFYQLISE